MVKISIVNIANKMPEWINMACTEYLKRINHGKYSCQIIEIKADRNTKKTAIENMKAEAAKITAAIPKDSFIIVLDEHGKMENSIKFAYFLEQTALNFQNITFIIGGADGIYPELIQKAHKVISLSHMVFPHALVRVIILEQIYRAISILENHPYHRE